MQRQRGLSAEACVRQAGDRMVHTLTRLLPERGVALLHGQLPPEQKQLAMERFTTGAARVLVSTTIVEVGLDVAAANVILIEHAPVDIDHRAHGSRAYHCGARDFHPKGRSGATVERLQ